MTLDDVLRELIEAVTEASGAPCIVGWTTINRWPEGAIEALKKTGLLHTTNQAETMECWKCEHHCCLDVVPLTRKDKPTRYFMVCDDSEMQGRVGRIEVPVEQLQQWRITTLQLAKLVANLLGIKNKVERQRNKNHIRIGMVDNGHGRKPLLLNQSPLALEINGNTIPLETALFFKDEQLVVDRAAVEKTETSNIPIAPPNLDSCPNTTPTKYVLKHCLGGWKIGPIENPIFIKSRSKEGYRYLGCLLIRPNKAFTPLDLQHTVNGAHLPNQLYSGMPDEQLEEENLTKQNNSSYQKLTQSEMRTCKEYKNSLAQLREEMDEATERGDHEEAEKLEEQFEQIRKELRKLTPIKGVLRDDKSDSQRARKSIQKNIKHAISEIRSTTAEIADFIEGEISLGEKNFYTPSNNDRSWEFTDEVIK